MPVKADHTGWLTLLSALVLSSEFDLCNYKDILFVVSHFLSGSKPLLTHFDCIYLCIFTLLDHTCLLRGSYNGLTIDY